IDVQDKNNPTVKGRIISYDSMDIGYPSIAYAGGGFGADQSMMITFSHVSRTKFPGNSVIYADWDGELSAPIHLRRGDGSINVLQDTIERWGDYTGIQPIYNKLGECIITNSYGVPNGGHNTWVSRVKSNDVRLGMKQNTAETAQQISIYPVPTKDYAQIEFELKQSMILTFSLVDIQGKLTIELLRDKGKVGINKFTFSTSDLPNGVYILNVNNHEKNIISKRIVVAH
ncbi:MAG: T9SS type A sorting domain-containing protein, partial [Bacteroidia bacterium]